MSALSRRRFLQATGTVVGLSAAVPGAPATLAAASVTKGGDLTFANQSKITGGNGAVQLSAGAEPPAGSAWNVQRVFWNVNYDGVIADNIQTYLYRLPASYSVAQAMQHMAVSLVGWLGCCGNGGLTGNGDMTFAPGDVVLRPGELLWILFLTPTDAADGFTMAAGMSARQVPA